MGMRSQQIVLRLLADARLQPAAVQLLPLGDDPARLQTLLAGPEMASLAASFPCVIDAADAARLNAAQLAAASAAGCRLLAAGAILVAESAPADLSASGAQYLALAGDPPPVAKAATGKTGSRALALRLAQLVAADADTREIEEVFRLEPTLAYHLLRLVNSPGVGVGRQITSFAQAILILGRKQLRRWLNLLLFSAKDDPRAPMLLARATLRARSIELLAREAGLDREAQESAFMVGMFSLLGVMFGMPLAEVLAPLKLDPELVAALLRREGELGGYLAIVEAAEQGDAAALQAAMQSVPAALLPATLDFDLLRLDACRWMLSLLQASPERNDG